MTLCFWRGSESCDRGLKKQGFLETVMEKSSAEKRVHFPRETIIRFIKEMTVIEAQNLGYSILVGDFIDYMLTASYV